MKCHPEAQTRTLRLGFPSDEPANVRGLRALTRAVLHRGGGQAPSPNPLGCPSRTPAYPGRGSAGQEPATGQGKEAAPSPFCLPPLPGAALLPGRGQWAKSPRGCQGAGSGGVLGLLQIYVGGNERRTRAQDSSKGQGKAFSAQGCRCCALAQLSPCLEWGCTLGAAGGGGSSPAPTPACIFCCGSKGAFSSRTKGFGHFLMCDRKGSLRRG